MTSRDPGGKRDVVRITSRDRGQPAIKVTKQRGEILIRETPRGERQFMATVQPSSILRTRGDREAEFQALVTDLQIAARAIRRSSGHS